MFGLFVSFESLSAIVAEFELVSVILTKSSLISWSNCFESGASTIRWNSLSITQCGLVYMKAQSGSPSLNPHTRLLCLCINW